MTRHQSPKLDVPTQLDWRDIEMTLPNLQRQLRDVGAETAHQGSVQSGLCPESPSQVGRTERRSFGKSTVLTVLGESLTML